MNVPKLRFKEFNDYWIETKIQNVASVVGGGTPSTDEPKYWGNEINWFTPSETGKTKYVAISNRKISQDGLKNSSAKLLPKGTILLSSRATVGEASILLNEASTNQGFQSLIVNENNCNEFIYYLKYKYKREMLIKSFGSTFLEISKSNVENIKIKIPSIEEQFKIANFLSLLDKKIELQSKKIEDLKLFKSSQISSVIDSLKCDEIELREIGNFISGNAIGKEKIKESGVPIILYGDLYTKYWEVIDKVEQYTEDNEKYIKSKKNDLLFPTSTTVDSISLISPSSINIDDVIYGGDLIVFRADYTRINSDFLSYQINHYKRKEFSKKAQGSTIIHIHAEDLLSSKVKLPNIEIQNLISKTFNILNKKIIKEEEKLNKLNNLKKGLMQSMFV